MSATFMASTDFAIRLWCSGCSGPPIHNTGVMNVDEPAVELILVGQHQALLLGREVAHHRHKEAAVFILDVPWVEFGQGLEAVDDVGERPGVAGNVTRFGLDQPGRGLTAEDVFGHQFVHQLPVLIGKRLCRQVTEEDILFLAVVETVGVGADEVNRRVDIRDISGAAASACPALRRITSIIRSISRCSIINGATGRKGFAFIGPTRGVRLRPLR